MSNNSVKTQSFYYFLIKHINLCLAILTIKKFFCHIQHFSKKHHGFHNLFLTCSRDINFNNFPIFHVITCLHELNAASVHNFWKNGSLFHHPPGPAVAEGGSPLFFGFGPELLYLSYVGPYTRLRAPSLNSSWFIGPAKGSERGGGRKMDSGMVFEYLNR